MTAQVPAQPAAEPVPALADVAPPPRVLTTRTGTNLIIRPATEADVALLEEFFEQVSAEDRRFRFLGAQTHVGQELLEPMTRCDHFRTENFLAFANDAGAGDGATGDGGELVGTAMLACDNPLDTGEIAVSIRRDRRGQGIGWALLDLIANEAAKRGLRRVISIESRENRAAIELEREKGFVARAIDGDPTLVLLEKVLR